MKNSCHKVEKASKKVVVLKIEEYNFNILKKNIKESLLKHFSFDKLFSPQDRILLKPNLLMEANPDEAITTHPIFIEAVGAIFQEMDYPVFIADSPGGFVDNKDMDFIYGATGIKEIANRYNFELLHPTQSRVCQDLPLCWWTEGFKMINLPKLKTHDIMILTLATKNLYGCISGLHKSHIHKVYPKAADFTSIILKLYKMIKPSLNIVDGILALEGNGPAKKGKPKKLGIVVIGDDALYTDYVIGRLLGLDDKFNPLINKAKEQGLFNENMLELVCDIPYENFNNFKFPSPFILNSIPSPLVSLLKLFLKFKPFVDIRKCTGCSQCKEVCPQNAIEIEKAKAHIDYKKCIMCMCCGEMCSFGAIDLNKSLLLKFIEFIHR
ncbi:MAG: DUF362 domain-containing protein [Candidatus Omnitrophota bacterium]|nr:DUF362 domain-containing protein [Candidatus Omnitrophota bacterium]